MNTGKERKRRGPAPKPKDEKAEQLTIRLLPKQKLGLELLLRSQRGRSLSQVVEWAISRGMSSVQVGPNSKSIADLLEECWIAPTEWRRLSAIHSSAPELLDFLESAIVDFVNNSVEAKALRIIVEQAFRTQNGLTAGPSRDKKVANYSSVKSRAETALSRLVEHGWKNIKAHVERIESEGRELRGQRLVPVAAGQNFPVNRVEDIEELNERIGAAPWQPSRS